MAKTFARGGFRTPLTTWSVRAAAALFIFAAGWTTRGQIGPPAADPSPDGTEDYMLLIWGGPDPVEEAGAAAVAAEYEAWARSLMDRGVAVSGNELARDRTMIGDIADAEPTASLGGYFLISLAPGQDVSALIQDHPHLAYGGWIEAAPLVRRP